MSAGESLPVLVDRLRAALDAHERIARDATPGPWEVEPNRSVRAGDELVVASVTARNLWPSGHDASFIAINDPAHVLRTIQAHRTILARHIPRSFEHTGATAVWCMACVAIDEINWFDDEIAYQLFPCDDVRALASIYFPESDAT